MTETFADIIKNEGLVSPLQKRAQRAGKMSSVLRPDDGDDLSFNDKAVYIKNGVDARCLKELRKYKPQSDLDLHGLTVDESRDRLDDFLALALSQKKRQVEIIHGRGAHAADGRAVLRAKVRQWLVGCDFVLAYTETENNRGAVQVLLKLSR